MLAFLISMPAGLRESSSATRPTKDLDVDRFRAKYGFGRITVVAVVFEARKRSLSQSRSLRLVPVVI